MTNFTDDLVDSFVRVATDCRRGADGERNAWAAEHGFASWDDAFNAHKKWHEERVAAIRSDPRFQKFTIRPKAIKGVGVKQ